MEWIAIKDRLPKKDAPYLVFAESADPKKPFIQIAWYNPLGMSWSLIPTVWINAITHWMPLPRRPKARSPLAPDGRAARANSDGDKK